MDSTLVFSALACLREPLRAAAQVQRHAAVQRGQRNQSDKAAQHRAVVVGVVGPLDGRGVDQAVDLGPVVGTREAGLPALQLRQPGLVQADTCNLAGVAHHEGHELAQAAPGKVCS